MKTICEQLFGSATSAQLTLHKSLTDFFTQSQLEPSIVEAYEADAASFYRIRFGEDDNYRKRYVVPSITSLLRAPRLLSASRYNDIANIMHLEGFRFDMDDAFGDLLNNPLDKRISAYLDSHPGEIERYFVELNKGLLEVRVTVADPKNMLGMREGHANMVDKKAYAAIQVGVCVRTEIDIATKDYLQFHLFDTR